MRWRTIADWRQPEYSKTFFVRKIIKQANKNWDKIKKFLKFFSIETIVMSHQRKLKPSIISRKIKILFQNPFSNFTTKEASAILQNKDRKISNRRNAVTAFIFSNHPRTDFSPAQRFQNCEWFSTFRLFTFSHSFQNFSSVQYLCEWNWMKIF